MEEKSLHDDDVKKQPAQNESAPEEGETEEKADDMEQDPAKDKALPEDDATEQMADGANQARCCCARGECLLYKKELLHKSWQPAWKKGRFARPVRKKVCPG